MKRVRRSKVESVGFIILANNLPVQRTLNVNLLMDGSGTFLPQSKFIVVSVQLSCRDSIKGRIIKIEC